MEFTQDKIFDIKYDNEVDLIKLKNEKGKILNSINRHKIVSAMIGATFLLSIFNVFLIVNFFKILSTI